MLFAKQKTDTLTVTQKAIREKTWP